MTAVRQLLDTHQVRKVLVIAPKTVAEATWTSEAAKWDETAGLRISLVLGEAKKRIAALEADADIYVINRENVPWLTAQYPRRTWPFDMAVIDESSSFKNGKSQRFKALKSVRSQISRMVLLTGTPSPNGLLDLWAQIYLLDQGERLEKFYSHYRERYFVPDKRSRDQIFSWKPGRGAQKEIEDKISDICISMSANDYLTLPDCITDDIPVVLDAKARARYDKLEAEAVLQITDGTITAGSAAVLTGKLAQLANGAAYDSETGEVMAIHDCKVEALLETLEQLGDEHCVVYYRYQHDRDRILTALEKTKKRVKVYKSAADADSWNNGEIDVLLAQPASCGYGLNLQAGGHHIIWYGLTWSLEEYLQANKRLHRQGQQKPVIIHRLISQGTVDQDIVRALEKKDRSQDALLTALKARITKAKKGKKNERKETR